MTYQEKARDIIKDSISSAIFIDENARSFFQSEASLTGANEEKLSIELYESFKECAITLDVHKYQSGDESNQEVKDYLFNARDLVLLDWHLNGQEGEDKSLLLLKDIINRPSIHFCAIYTTEKEVGINNVFNNILSFFSGYNKDYYDGLKENIESEEGIDDIKGDLDYININRDKKDSGNKIGRLLGKHKALVNKILEVSGCDKDKKCALINASIALMDTYKPEEKNTCPSLVSFDNKTIVINNTIITILNKEDNKPSELVDKLSSQIIQHKASFTQLLGLEMKTILSQNGSFLDSEMLKVSKDAFIYHRKKYVKDKMEHLFPEFIKDVMLEKVNLTLRNENITLLDSVFLDSIDEDKCVGDEELISMNVFYNSTKLKTDNKLNFGDVFIDESKNEYYICITALCDCLRPEKIKNNFFFAEGSKINKDEALKLGDSAFISYLTGNKIVKWTIPDSNVEGDGHKYTPVYIKPSQYTVVSTNFDEADGNSIELSFLNHKGAINSKKVKYVTTIKNNYAQRIANHAFAHPVRVGVDFVKK